MNQWVVLPSPRDKPKPGVPLPLWGQHLDAEQSSLHHPTTSQEPTPSRVRFSPTAPFLLGKGLPRSLRARGGKERHSLPSLTSWAAASEELQCTAPYPPPSAV